MEIRSSLVDLAPCSWGTILDVLVSKFTKFDCREISYFYMFIHNDTLLFDYLFICY